MRSMLPTLSARPTLPMDRLATPAQMKTMLAMPPGAAMESLAAHGALEVLRQPPATWYKDQFGRKATFDVHVKRATRGCQACVDHRLLSLQLLYENGKVVENQDIMRVASGLCLSKDGETTIAVRIMEVSKNHQNQRFRLHISLPQCPLAPMPTPGMAVITDPVLVLSKKNNKRTVKANEEETQANVLKAKKSKLFDSPEQMKQEHASPRLGPRLQQDVAMGTPTDAGEYSEAGGMEPSWAAQVVRFKQPTDSVCLWANAAYNFLSRMQWLRELPVEAPTGSVDGLYDTRQFECPMCGAHYGRQPLHESDCDLALLLQQNDSAVDTPEQAKVSTGYIQGGRAEPCAPGFTFGSNACGGMFPPDDAVTKPLPSGSSVQASQPPAFGAASVDLLAKHLNIGSWETYSSFSKLIFSFDPEAKTQDPFQPGGRNPSASTSTCPSIGQLCLSSAASFRSAHTPPSLSSILSAKDLSPETAALLAEQEADLTGDANLLKSLSRVSLSDLLPHGDGDETKIERARDAVTSLSAVLNSPSTQPSEDQVHTIALADFRHCGFPAFDAGRSLLGFYVLSEAEDAVELRFLPNFYPLPPPMLQELEADHAKWQQGEQLLALGSKGLASLDDLKRAAISRLQSQGA